MAKRWYIVHAYTNFERKVADAIRERAKAAGLEGLVDEVLVPTEEVIEVKRGPDQTEALQWFCERCDTLLHEVTMHVADIEKQLKSAIEQFDASVDLRTCRRCGHLQPDKPPVPQPPPKEHAR